MGNPEGDRITFTCDGCTKPFTVPAVHGGRRAICKACGHSMLVPTVSQRRVVPPVVSRPGFGRQPSPPHTPAVEQATTRPVIRTAPPALPPRPLAAAVAADQVLASFPRRVTPSASHPLRHPRGWGGAGLRLGGLAIALVGICGIGLAGFYHRPLVAQRFGSVVRAAARVMPAARPLSPIRVIGQEEVDAVIRQTATNDLSSTNVYHQVATYSRGVMRMASLVALSYGATEDDVRARVRAVEAAESQAQTVHQQTAVCLEGSQLLLAAAAKASGAHGTKVEAILAKVRSADLASSTVHQQCVNYSSGCLELSALLAAGEGVSSDRIGLITSGVRAGDAGADTVHQQHVAYLSGLVDMLAVAANSRGAGPVKPEAILQEMRVADSTARTVFQQEVNVLVGIMKMLGILAMGA